MARNPIRDIEEEKRRKSQLISAGFQLFSEYGIENVTLSDIAIKANVGIATLYKYYQNKINLVIAISASLWKKSLEEYLLLHSMEELYTLSAYQLIDLYLDRIIAIYNEHPEVLRFSGNYKTYIRREGATEKQILEHTQVLDSLSVLFHKKYEDAKTDKSIRTDIEEKDMFSMFTLSMLSMAERYAMGIIWADTKKDNHTQELLFLKEMILAWCSNREDRI